MQAVAEDPVQSDHIQPIPPDIPQTEAVPEDNIPLIGAAEQPEEYTLPCIDWGSSACLAELEKITRRPVQTVPSFLLSASENLYGRLVVTSHTNF